MLIQAQVVYSLFTDFKTLKTQINEQTLQAALQAKADELLPTLQDKFTKAAMDAVPTYRELAMKRLKTLRPKLQAMITEEAKSLSNRIPVMCRKKQIKACRE